MPLIVATKVYDFLGRRRLLRLSALAAGGFRPLATARRRGFPGTVSKLEALREQQSETAGGQSDAC